MTPREPIPRRCQLCDGIVKNRRCLSCELYNAAVMAQRAAAEYLAQERGYDVIGAYMNETGIYARLDRVLKKIGTAEEAAPFMPITSEARKVHR